MIDIHDTTKLREFADSGVSMCLGLGASGAS